MDDPSYVANCTPTTHLWNVRLFGESGEGQRRFAEQLEIRSGMTAFDPSKADRKIVSALENFFTKDDGIAYVPGRGIVLSTSVPPPPSPHPRNAQTFPPPPHPPPFPPNKAPQPPPLPPPSPPPWCGMGLGWPLATVPIDGKAETKMDETVRHVCAYARRVLDASITATACFGDRVDDVNVQGGDYPYLHNAPPTPPNFGSAMDAAAWDMAHSHPPPPPPIKFIPSFAYGHSGRRLNAYEDGAYTEFEQSILSVTRAPVTRDGCAELCHSQSKCLAYTTRPQYEKNVKFECVLLRGTGACTLRDFATQLSVQATQSGTASQKCDVWSGQRCLELPSIMPPDISRMVANKPPIESTITYSIAQESCVARDSFDANGDNLTPHPLTAAEAFGFISLSRWKGVNAFWAARPNGVGSTFWPWEEPGGLGKPDDGTRKGCVLIFTPYSSLYMAATIAPCEAPMATGLVCTVNVLPIPSAPPTPPNLPPMKSPPPVRAMEARAMYSNTPVRRATATICRLLSANHLRDACNAAVQILLPTVHLGGNVESPLCGQVNSKTSVVDASKAAGGAYCWATCAEFVQYPQPQTAREGCLNFVRAECPRASALAATKLCTDTYLPPPPPSAGPPPPTTPFRFELEHLGFTWYKPGRCKSTISETTPLISTNEAEQGRRTLKRGEYMAVQLPQLLGGTLQKSSSLATAALCAEQCTRFGANGPSQCTMFAASKGNVRDTTDNHILNEYADCFLYVASAKELCVPCYTAVTCGLKEQTPDPIDGQYNLFVSSNRPPAPPPPPLGNIIVGEYECPMLASLAACRAIAWATMRVEIDETPHKCKMADIGCFSGCNFGTRSGTWNAVVPGGTSKNSLKCSMGLLPYCGCAYTVDDVPPPPPSAPAPLFENGAFATTSPMPISEGGASGGWPSVYFRLIGRGRAFDCADTALLNGTIECDPGDGLPKIKLLDMGDAGDPFPGSVLPTQSPSSWKLMVKTKWSDTPRDATAQACLLRCARNHMVGMRLRGAEIDTRSGCRCVFVDTSREIGELTLLRLARIAKQDSTVYMAHAYVRRAHTAARTRLPPPALNVPIRDAARVVMLPAFEPQDTPAKDAGGILYSFTYRPWKLYHYLLNSLRGSGNFEEVLFSDPSHYVSDHVKLLDQRWAAWLLTPVHRSEQTLNVPNTMEEADIHANIDMESTTLPFYPKSIERQHPSENTLRSELNKSSDSSDGNWKNVLYTDEIPTNFHKLQNMHASVARMLPTGVVCAAMCTIAVNKRWESGNGTQRALTMAIAGIYTSTSTSRENMEVRCQCRASTVVDGFQPITDVEIGSWMETSAAFDGTQLNNAAIWAVEMNPRLPHCKGDTDANVVSSDLAVAWLKPSTEGLYTGMANSNGKWCTTSLEDKSIQEDYRLVTPLSKLSYTVEPDVSTGDSACAQACEGEPTCGAATYNARSFGSASERYETSPPTPPPPAVRWAAKCIHAEPPHNKMCEDYTLLPEKGSPVLKKITIKDPCECSSHQFNRPTLLCEGEEVVVWTPPGRIEPRSPRPNAIGMNVPIAGDPIVLYTLPQAEALLLSLNVAREQYGAEDHTLQSTAATLQCPWEWPQIMQPLELPGRLSGTRFDPQMNEFGDFDLTQVSPSQTGLINQPIIIPPHIVLESPEYLLSGTYAEPNCCERCMENPRCLLASFTSGPGGNPYESQCWQWSIALQLPTATGGLRCKLNPKNCTGDLGPYGVWMKRRSPQISDAYVLQSNLIRVSDTVKGCEIEHGNKLWTTWRKTINAVEALEGASPPAPPANETEPPPPPPAPPPKTQNAKWYVGRYNPSNGRYSFTENWAIYCIPTDILQQPSFTNDTGQPVLIFTGVTAQTQAERRFKEIRGLTDYRTSAQLTSLRSRCPWECHGDPAMHDEAEMLRASGVLESTRCPC